MLNIFNSIFGSSKVIEGALKGIDAMVFTDEEKNKTHLAFLDRYEPFKITQRFLAVLFCLPYVLFASYGLIIDDESIITGANTLFGMPVSLIIGFYFMGGLVNGIKK